MNIKSSIVIEDLNHSKYFYWAGIILLFLAQLARLISPGYHILFIDALAIIVLLFPEGLKKKSRLTHLLLILPFTIGWYFLVNYQKFCFSDTIVFILMIVFSSFIYYIYYHKPINSLFSNTLYSQKTSFSGIKNYLILVILLDICLIAFMLIYPTLDYRPYHALIWFGIIALTAIPFYWLDKFNNNSPFKLTVIGKKELLFILFSVILIFFYYHIDVNSWKYMFIGDEYAFYTYAKGIIEGGFSINIFSFIGVYAEHPVMCSYVSALFMYIFGISTYSWKLAYITFSIIGIVSFYLYTRTFSNVRYSALSALLLAFSTFYIIFGAHHTQNFSYGLTIILLSMAICVMAIKKSSSFLAYLAGVSLGFCLYFHYIGRIAFIIIPISLILLLKGKDLFYFLLTMSPGLFITLQFYGDNSQLTSNSFERTVFFKENSLVFLPNNIIQYFLTLTDNIFINIFNFIRSLFYFNGSGFHFIYNPLLDVITVSGLIVGFIYLICQLKIKSRFAIICLINLLIAFTICVIIAKFTFSIDSKPQITRYFFLLPFLITIASTGIYVFINSFFKTQVSQNITTILILSIVFICSSFYLFIQYKTQSNIGIAGHFIHAIQKSGNHKDIILITQNPKTFNTLYLPISETPGLSDKKVTYLYLSNKVLRGYQDNKCLSSPQTNYQNAIIITDSIQSINQYIKQYNIHSLNKYSFKVINPHKEQIYIYRPYK